MLAIDRPAAIVRRAIAELESGMPIERSTLAPFLEGSRAAPGGHSMGRGVLTEGTRMVRPSIAAMISDLRQYLHVAWAKEKTRSEKDRLVRQGGTYTIGLRRSEPSRPQLTRTQQWWTHKRARSQHQGSARGKIAIAWAFSEDLGAPLADVLRMIAEAIDEDEEAFRAQRITQAGSEISSHVLSLLPVAGIIGAGILGVNPWDFFLSSLLGASTLLVGVGLMLAGYGVSRSLVRRAEKEGTYTYDLALMMNLTVAGLQSGASIPAVLRSLALCCGVSELSGVADSLLRGRPWWESWERVPAECEPLAEALEVGWCEGASPIGMLQSGAHEWRRELYARRQAADAHLGVRLLLPLGLLQLPSFIALGVVPVIAEIAASV